MNIEELQKKLVSFRDERNWSQFHTFKDLLLGLSGEVSELSEHFLWKGDEQIKSYLIAPGTKKEIAMEMADVFNYLLLLAEKLDIDLVKSSEEKIKINAEKYPVDKSYGNNKKYTQL